MPYVGPYEPASHLSERSLMLQAAVEEEKEIYCKPPKGLNWHTRRMIALDLPFRMEERQRFCKLFKLYWEVLSLSKLVFQSWMCQMYRKFLSKAALLFQFCGLVNNWKPSDSCFPTNSFQFFTLLDMPSARDLFQLSWKANCTALVICQIFISLTHMKSKASIWNNSL